MIVSLADINQFLPDRLKLDSVSGITTLATSAKSHVYSKVALAYDTTSWTDETNTPDLIRSLISMFIAAWLYNKEYADGATEAGSYGRWLYNQAEVIRNGLYNGTLIIEDVDPKFDRTQPGVFETDPVFEMGRIF